MKSPHRSSLEATDVAQFVLHCSKAFDSLAPFLDDLNALGGSDFDTGTNAARSFRAIVRLMNRSGDLPTSASALLHELSVYARTVSIGHVGILITSLIDGMAQAAPYATVRPIDMREYLRSLPDLIDQSFSAPAVELVEMAHAARTVADSTNDPIVASHIMVGNASMAVQDSLVEATSGWVNPGACVLAVMLSALHSVYEGSQAPLEVARGMMSSLSRSTNISRRPAGVHIGAQFSVDFHVDCMVEDVLRFKARLDEGGYRYSTQGSSDQLGMGTWRFHIDTSSPTAVLPRVGWVRHVVVKDSRYGELIGYDELALQEEAAGVLYLSRPTWQRPETVRVIALVRNEDLLVEVASTGAHVVLNPVFQDAVVVQELMLSAPAKVSLALAGDDAGAEVIERAQRLASLEDDVRVVLDTAPRSDVTVSVLAAAATPIFMPQVEERTQQVTVGLLEAAVSKAKARVAVIDDLDPAVATKLAKQLVGYRLERVVVLGLEPDAVSRQIIEMTLAERSWSHSVEYVRAVRPQVVVVHR